MKVNSFCEIRGKNLKKYHKFDEKSDFGDAFRIHELITAVLSKFLVEKGRNTNR